MKTSTYFSKNAVRKILLTASILAAALFTSEASLIDLQDLQNSSDLKARRLELLQKLEKGSVITADDIKLSFNRTLRDEQPPFVSGLPSWNEWPECGEFSFHNFPEFPDLPEMPPLPCIEDPFFHFDFTFSDTLKKFDYDLRELNEYLKRDLEELRKQMDTFRNSDEFAKAMDELKKSNEQFKKEMEKMKEELKKVQKEIREQGGEHSTIIM